MRLCASGDRLSPFMIFDAKWGPLNYVRFFETYNETVAENKISAKVRFWLQQTDIDCN